MLPSSAAQAHSLAGSVGAFPALDLPAVGSGCLCCWGCLSQGAQLLQWLGSSAWQEREHFVTRAASRLWARVSGGHTFLEEHQILSIRGAITLLLLLIIFSHFPPLLSLFSSFLIKDKMFPVFLKDSFHEIILISLCVSVVAWGAVPRAQTEPSFVIISKANF